MPKIKDLDKSSFLDLLDIYIAETDGINRKTQFDMHIFRKAIAGEDFSVRPGWRPFSHKGYAELFKESIFLVRLHEEASRRFLEIWPEYTPEDE
jgi:hypothetical protein